MGCSVSRAHKTWSRLFEFEQEWEGGGVGVGAYPRRALIRSWALIGINKPSDHRRISGRHYV